MWAARKTKMSNKRIYTTNSKKKTFHFSNCPCAGRIKDVSIATKSNLLWMGYRPCECCNTMTYRFRLEEAEIQRFADEKGVEVNPEKDVLSIKTRVGSWRIVYIKDEQIFILYHGNHNIRTGYHRQKDKLASKTIMDYIQYIYRHDLFREAEANGYNRKVDKKYEKSVKKAKQRKAFRSIDNLFAQIEADNQEYKVLSYC